MIAPADLDLHVLRSARTGPAGARNRGAGVATGPLLAFVDDDCEPRPAVGRRDGQPRSSGSPTRSCRRARSSNAHPRDACAAAARTPCWRRSTTTPPHQFLATREPGAAPRPLHRPRPAWTSASRQPPRRIATCAPGRSTLGMRVVLVQEAERAPPPAVRRQAICGASTSEYGRGARRLARQPRRASGCPPVRAGRGFPRALARSTLRAARAAGSPAVVPLVGLTQLATAWGYATRRAPASPPA